MRFCRKKGMEKETLVLLILALVFLVWYVFFYDVYRLSTDQSASVLACKASVERNARLHLRGIEFPTSVDCPAESLAITDVKTANEKIANSMYDCWYKFGEGKLNLFTDEATFCSVCTFIDVKTDKPVTGLPIYLMENQIPDKSGRFYSDYLTGVNTPKAEQILGELKKNPVVEDKADGNLEGGTTYATIFVYAKGFDELRKLGETLTAKTFENKAGLMFGALGGLTVGTSLAGGSALIGLATVGAVTGPPGWIIVGGSILVGVTVGAVIGFFESPDHPESASLIVLREWDTQKDPEKAADILTDQLGCNYFPAKLE